MASQMDKEGRLFTDIKDRLTIDQENQLLTGRIVARREVDPEWTESSYGHAALTLAVLQRNASSVEESPEAQREMLIKQREQLVAKFGMKIIECLREELGIDLQKL